MLPQKHDIRGDCIKETWVFKLIKKRLLLLLLQHVRAIWLAFSHKELYLG